MRVFIWGNKGNMGRRYAAILNYLGHEAVGTDVVEGWDKWYSQTPSSYDAVIIATSTDTHSRIIRAIANDTKAKILCEKPISTDIKIVRSLLTHVSALNTQLSMVSQYDYLIPMKGKGETSYDFYQSGADGLAWDCINIIKHARGKISLKNESPIWKCWLNGVMLDIGRMNYAYVEMIEDWLIKPYVPQYRQILSAHKKVLDFLDGKFN